MARYSNSLPELVRAALQRKGLSARDVARMSESKISHMTINEMMRGVVPSPRKVAVFAITIGEHPDVFLEAAGEPFRYVGELNLSSVREGDAIGEALAAPR